MRDLEDEARIRAYMEAKMKHIKMYNECMNLADGLDVAKFAKLVRADEREGCAKLIEADGIKRDKREKNGDRSYLFYCIRASQLIRERVEK